MEEYKVVRSKRKTISLEVTKDMEIIVRAPLKMGEGDINKFVSAHSDWLKKTLAKIDLKRQNDIYLNEEQVKFLKAKAKEYIPKRVAELSEIVKAVPKGVKITSAETRFGSCSGKNSLCFSYRLMAYEKKAVDYVIIHELCHIKEHNHSKRFWTEVQKYMPDYKSAEKILKSFNVR